MSGGAAARPGVGANKRDGGNAPNGKVGKEGVTGVPGSDGNAGTPGSPGTAQDDNIFSSGSPRLPTTSSS